MEIYQDIYSQGRLITKGVRECDSRYLALREFVFSKYKRKFTIFDLGANFGYFSIRALEDYDATAVMVQGGEQADRLTSLCKENLDLKLTLLNLRISSSQLKELSKSENFDVVLALNVLHHFGDDWKVGAEALLSLGHLIVVESPDPKDKGACGKDYLEEILEFFKSREHEIIGQFSRHTDADSKGTMLVVKGKPPEVVEPFMGWEDRPGNHNSIKISSTLEHREVKKSNHKEGTAYWMLPWINGMNLQNFLTLGGGYPKVSNLLTKLKKKEILSLYGWDDTHKDICIHNFILNGSDLHLIDIEGNNGDSSDESGMNKCIRKLEAYYLNGGTN